MSTLAAEYSGNRLSNKAFAQRTEECGLRDNVVAGITVKDLQVTDANGGALSAQPRPAGAAGLHYAAFAVVGSDGMGRADNDAAQITRRRWKDIAC